MKQIFIAITAGFFAAMPATPVLSEDSTKNGGTSLIEDGAKMFLEGLMREFEPAMKDLQGLADTMQPAMRSFLREMGPALGDILEKVQDFSAYHAPEILPNGDIIMRKKTPKEMDVPEAETEGEIET